MQESNKVKVMELSVQLPWVVAVAVLSIVMIMLVVLLYGVGAFGGGHYEYLLLNIPPGTSKEALKGHLKTTLQSKLTNRFRFGTTSAFFSCTQRLDPDDWEKCETYRGHSLLLVHRKSGKKVQCSEKLADRIEDCQPNETRVTQKTYKDANRKPFHTVQLNGSWAEIFVILDQLLGSSQSSNRKENSRASFSSHNDDTKPLLGKKNTTDKHPKRQESPLDVVQPHCDSCRKESLDIEVDLYSYATTYCKDEMERILNPKPLSSKFISSGTGTLMLEGQACLVSKAAEDVAVFCQRLTTTLSKFEFKLSEGISAEAFRHDAESKVAAPNKTLLCPKNVNIFILYGPKDRLNEVKEGLKHLESQLKSPARRIEVQPKNGSGTPHSQAEQMKSLPAEPRSVFHSDSSHSTPSKNNIESKQFPKVEINREPSRPGHQDRSNGETSRNISPRAAEKAKPNKITVYVFKGDLTKQNTNVIVNPANRKLKHGGGAAKAIASAAGSKLVKECQDYVHKYGELRTGNVMHTTAGNLSPRIRHVIHAVGPIADHYPVKRDLERKMEETFFNCLMWANDKLHAKSISIPAISAGIYGVPKELVARAAHTALRKFEQEGTGKPMTLEEVNFVNIDDDSTDAFQEVFEGREPHKASEDLGRVRSAESRSADEPKRKRVLVQRASNSISDHEGAESGLLNGGAVKNAMVTVANGDNSEDCVICMEVMTSPKTLPCGHKFCEDCIKDSFEKCQPKCPSCGRLFGMMRGNQPPGKMSLNIVPQSLTGYESYKMIVVQYDIPNGIQNDSHPNPGTQYWGTNRTAYLPDSKEGREVCALLRKAFDAGLIFTVGRSTTTGRDNQVIWNDIHHKTSFSGPYGYPDPSYLSRVKDELKAKGIVPGADDHKHKQTVL